jgi:hypothetical protein
VGGDAMMRGLVVWMIELVLRAWMAHARELESMPSLLLQCQACST